MSKEYTKEQLDVAEKFAKLLASYPPEQRKIIVIAANAFIEGMAVKDQLLSRADESAASSAADQVLQEA